MVVGDGDEGVVEKRRPKVDVDFLLLGEGAVVLNADIVLSVNVFVGM